MSYLQASLDTPASSKDKSAPDGIISSNLSSMGLSCALQASSGQSVESVVPSSAVEAMVRPDVKGTRGCPASCRTALAAHHGSIMQLALAGINIIFPSRP